LRETSKTKFRRVPLSECVYPTKQPSMAIIWTRSTGLETQ